MFRHRSKLLQATLALILLITSVVLLWPLLNTSVAYAATCGTGANFVCITPIAAVNSTLNGTDQTVSYTLNFSVKSNTTSWNVTISSTQFKTGGSPVRTLPTTASSVTGVCQQGNPCSPFPNNQVSYPIPMIADGSSTYKLCNATANGKSSFNFAATIQVTVPGNTYAGSYTSTITLALITGTP